MKTNWTELIAVFVVFAMLQGHAFIGRAFGEALIPEDTPADNARLHPMIVYPL